MVGKEILLSDMRGSLGGNVFSRNRFGNYVRLRVSPIQPNTPAQLGAKTTFGSSAPVFRSLSASEKQLFNNFARLSFQPRNKTNLGRYTGQLAFTALWTQFQNSLRINRNFTISKNDVILPGGITTTPFEGPIAAGLSNLLVPVATDNNGAEQALSLINANLSASGEINFKLQMGNGNGFDFIGFSSPSTGNFGFTAFSSSSNPVEGMAFRNKEKYFIGAFNRAQFVVPADGDGANNFTITSTDFINTLDYQSFPAQNTFVLISVYMSSNTNQVKLIGRFEVQVTGGP